MLVLMIKECLLKIQPLRGFSVWPAQLIYVTCRTVYAAVHLSYIIWENSYDYSKFNSKSIYRKHISLIRKKRINLHRGSVEWKFIIEVVSSFDDHSVSYYWYTMNCCALTTILYLEKACMGESRLKENNMNNRIIYRHIDTKHLK